MSLRSREGILILGTVLIAAAVLLIVLRRSPSEDIVSTWSADVRFPVRVIDDDRTFDVDLADYPAIGGRVAYEGPALAEGQENWKPAHDYRGVDLAAVLDRTVGLDAIETVTLVALDGWHKTLSREVLDGGTPAGTVILALSADGVSPVEWDDAPMLVLLPADERFSNQDMLDALGPNHAHYFGDGPSATGLQVKGVAFLVIDYGGGRLPMLSDL